MEKLWLHDGFHYFQCEHYATAVSVLFGVLTCYHRYFASTSSLTCLESVPGELCRR